MRLIEQQITRRGFQISAALMALWPPIVTAAEQKLPDEAQIILDAPDSVTVYSLETAKSKDGTKETFHDWIVLSKADVKNADEQKKLIGGMEKLINAGKSGARCFTPRHALRATKDGMSVDLVICFECAWVYVYWSGRDEAVRLAMGMDNFEDYDAVVEMFKKLLPK